MHAQGRTEMKMSLYEPVALVDFIDCPKPMVCVLKGQSPRETHKAERPDRVSGRAMSIHDRSAKYFITPQPPPSSYTRKTSPEAQYSSYASKRSSFNSNHLRRPSQLAPASQYVTTTSGRPSFPRASPHATATSGQPSSPPKSHNAKAESRRSSQLVASKPAEVEQPSASELLQMAMKNAVMYAVRHVDKLKLDDDDDDGDDDECDSDDDLETVSQYRRAGLIVVTKEGDSDDDEDDVNMETRSVKTIATRRSGVSRRSLFGNFDDDYDDSDGEESPFYQRPWSKASTTMTSLSRAVTARKMQRDMTSNSPRNTNLISQPRENRPPSFGIGTPRKSTSLTVPVENASSTSCALPDIHQGHSKPVEHSLSILIDTNRSVSGSSRLSQSRKKTVQIVGASASTSRQSHRQGESPYDVANKSSSYYPKSGSSRRSDVSSKTITSRRLTSSKSSNQQHGNGSAETSGPLSQSARRKASLKGDTGIRTSARSHASTTQTTKTQFGGSEKSRAGSDGRLSGSERVGLSGGNGDKGAMAGGASGKSKTGGGVPTPSGTTSREAQTLLPVIAR